MQQFKAEQLERAASAIFQAADTPKDIADHVAHSLVQSNLMGHDSHGVIRVPRYVELIKDGMVVPSARPTTSNETSTTAVVNGNWAFGQITARFGAELAIQKAKEMNVGVVGLVEQNHIGRLGEYSGMMAEAGMIGMVVTGGFRPPICAVAPFGGAARTLGTNPYSFAVPTGQKNGKQDMVLVDFATSVVAEGKLQVARAKGAPLAEGILLNKDGLPTTNANDFYAGGMILPVGGHKGYALALMADMMGAYLAGSDAVGKELNQTGTFMMAINVEAFRPLTEFMAAAGGRVNEIKAIPPAPGFKEVLVPGEPEFRTKAEREREGIGLPEATWEALVKTGQGLGVDVVAVAGV
ncbi:MAG: Ldh family oxidoreductase [Chloroflexota bacterium]